MSEMTIEMTLKVFYCGIHTLSKEFTLLSQVILHLCESSKTHNYVCNGEEEIRVWIVGLTQDFPTSD